MQLNTPFPNELANLFSSPATILADKGMEQFNAAMQNNQINQDLARQLYAQNQKMNPLLLEHQQAQTEYNKALAGESQARLPGVQAESGIKQNALTVDNATMSAKTKAALSKYLAEASESDMKQAMETLSQGLINPDPAVRARATMLYKNLPANVTEAYKQQLQGQRELANIKATGNNQLALEKQAAEHGKYNKAMNMSLHQKVMNELDPVKRFTGLNDLAVQAREAGDVEKADLYEKLAQVAKITATAKLNAAQPKPGSVDLNAIAGIPTQPSLDLKTAGEQAQDKLVKPAAVQYKPGETYKGKTGTYMYKGPANDPAAYADKKNWTRVGD